MRSESTAARSLPTGRLQKTAVLFAAMLLAALFTVFGTATAADAHDELAGSNPEEGASVEQVPEAIELTFSNVPAAIGSEIQVLDASGENWSEGAVSITDAVATQAVRAGAPAGDYTVNWRVVSSDSHSIEGSFAFTATEAAAGGEAAPGASVGTAGPI
ncbi:copper resistance CopC family protein, partial [Arthrobacter sp. H5]|uniref:copper resistance CopC family protein n=1 Tax=Arthrobacter sp. H5 TaxID=1267973 RepID=UPI000686D8C5